MLFLANLQDHHLRCESSIPSAVLPVTPPYRSLSSVRRACPASKRIRGPYFFPLFLMPWPPRLMGPFDFEAEAAAAFRAFSSVAKYVRQWLLRGIRDSDSMYLRAFSP